MSVHSSNSFGRPGCASYRSGCASFSSTYLDDVELGSAETLPEPQSGRAILLLDPNSAKHRKAFDVKFLAPGYFRQEGVPAMRATRPSRAPDLANYDLRFAVESRGRDFVSKNGASWRSRMTALVSPFVHNHGLPFRPDYEFPNVEMPDYGNEAYAGPFLDWESFQLFNANHDVVIWEPCMSHCVAATCAEHYLLEDRKAVKSVAQRACNVFDGSAVFQWTTQRLAFPNATKLYQIVNWRGVHWRCGAVRDYGLIKMRPSAYEDDLQRAFTEWKQTPHGQTSAIEEIATVEMVPIIGSAALCVEHRLEQFSRFLGRLDDPVRVCDVVVGLGVC